MHNPKTRIQAPAQAQQEGASQDSPMFDAPVQGKMVAPPPFLGSSAPLNTAQLQIAANNTPGALQRKALVESGLNRPAQLMAGPGFEAEEAVQMVPLAVDGEEAPAQMMEMDEEEESIQMMEMDEEDESLQMMEMDEEEESIQMMEMDEEDESIQMMEMDEEDESIQMMEMDEEDESIQMMEMDEEDESIQMMEMDEEDESIQMKSDSDPVQREEAPAPKPNNTGLPDNLKNGIEQLGGYSMDDVQVHYNSDKPAQLHAHAYAQGTDIHVGPGQEKHLPHEAWHVVQQKQGRVRPTMQMKGGVDVNDDAGLENEADVMGGKALQMKGDESKVNLSNGIANREGSIQRYVWEPVQNNGDENAPDEHHLSRFQVLGALSVEQRDYLDNNDGAMAEFNEWVTGPERLSLDEIRNKLSLLMKGIKTKNDISDMIKKHPPGKGPGPSGGFGGGGPIKADHSIIFK